MKKKVSLSDIFQAIAFHGLETVKETDPGFAYGTEFIGKTDDNMQILIGKPMQSYQIEVYDTDAELVCMFEVKSLT